MLSVLKKYKSQKLYKFSAVFNVIFMKIVYCKFTFITRGDEHACSSKNSIIKRTAP